MIKCKLCPRECGVDRKQQLGFCGAGEYPNIARAALHFWEEPCISGTHGSGTIFFCGCNLDCLYCQNHEINHSMVGESVDAQRLADWMLHLQKQGAHNINLVTPAIHGEMLLAAIPLARAAGLSIPIVYNTNAYEKVESIKCLDGLVDIYMPDLKYASSQIAQRYSNAADYFDYAAACILEMQKQVGTLVLDDNGIAQRGLLIRHLVLPGSVDETRMVLNFIAKSLPLDTKVSLMGQYVPTHRADFAPLNRKLLKREYDRAVEHCLSLGLTRVNTQNLSSANMAFRPTLDGNLDEL